MPPHSGHIAVAANCDALATVTSHHAIPTLSVLGWNPTRRSPAPLAVPPRGVTASAPEPAVRAGDYQPTVNDIDCQSDSASARILAPSAGQRGSTSQIREAPTTHPAYSQPSLSTAHTCSVVASIGLDVEIIVHRRGVRDRHRVRVEGKDDSALPEYPDALVGASDDSECGRCAAIPFSLVEVTTPSKAVGMTSVPSRAPLSSGCW